MNGKIENSGRANQTWIKLCDKIFAIFCIANYGLKNLKKFTDVSSMGKNNPDFFQNFSMISLAKKSEKRTLLNPPLLIQNGEWSENLAKSTLVQPLPYGRCEVWYGFKADLTWNETRLFPLTFFVIYFYKNEDTSTMAQTTGELKLLTCSVYTYIR